MRRIEAILWIHLKEFFKSPGALVLMFVMPITFSIIFGGMAVKSEKTKPVVNVVMAQDGPLEHRIMDLFKKNKSFKWEIVTLGQAEDHVKNQKVVTAILIPDHLIDKMAKDEPLFTLLVERKTEDYMSLVRYVEGTAKLLASTYHVAGESEFPQSLESVTTAKGVTVSKMVIQKESNSLAEVNLMFIGFAIMFMMFGLSGAASTILDERLGGTWGRLITTPVTKFQISLGYLLAYFLMGWIQFAVLMTSMTLVFHTTWGSLGYLIPFASIVILCVVGFGLMMAGLVKTKQQAIAMSSILIVSTSMVGGLYWPIEVEPLFMQKIALGVPQSWAMSGFKEIVSGSLHLATLRVDSMILMGFTIIFFTIGLRGINYK